MADPEALADRAMTVPQDGAMAFTLRDVIAALFIGIVLVAFIRKVLIGSLEHSTIMEYATKVGTLFVLALVYWLVSRADNQ